MKKRLFFGVASFIGFVLIFMWQIAAAELVDVQSKRNSPTGDQDTQVVFEPSNHHLFV